MRTTSKLIGRFSKVSHFEPGENKPSAFRVIRVIVVVVEIAAVVLTGFEPDTDGSKN